MIIYYYLKLKTLHKFLTISISKFTKFIQRFKIYVESACNFEEDILSMKFYCLFAEFQLI